MKSKQRLVSMLMSLALLVLIISGCSGGGVSSTKANNQADNEGATGTKAADKGKQIVIGAALPDWSDKWLGYLQDGIRKFEKTQNDIKVIYVDGQQDANKQLSQIETFISQKVDAIVFMPVDDATGAAVVDRVKQTKIPIVVVNRPFAGVEKADAFIGSKDIEAGTMQMEEIAKLLGGKGDIAIMMGPMGHAAQIGRTDGDKKVLAKHPDMKVVLEGSASWDRAKGMAMMENWLHSGKEFNAVVSNNDEMAIGAIMAAEAAGKLDKIVFAGVDATPDALEFVKSRKLKVTVYQNADGQGGTALETAVKLAKGEQVEKNIYVPFEIVTPANVDEYIKKWK
ncbi:sugar ABC transporter substrate-binding protein [Paenibacillus alginolyticus]|uniref:sugar ABC transporter substrate-binding protein n=1 Tax=Paenibacillus alginolyticus TaxID=59839 RepID=UPI000407CAAF|nr:sugar ABC transporter substrate-binding protein [Paenibacillus alginolyticus]MCY9665796.1 sugar ABC transporter substrate-binding protein [Paenibacillus alginolyticus]